LSRETPTGLASSPTSLDGVGVNGIGGRVSTRFFPLEAGTGVVTEGGTLVKKPRRDVCLPPDLGGAGFCFEDMPGVVRTGESVFAIDGEEQEITMIAG